jgi:hypothetical protein
MYRPHSSRVRIRKEVALMSELIPSGLPSLGLQRQVRRGLMQITVETGLATARVQSDAEIVSARMAAIANVGARAQEELALLVNRERQLADVVPDAEPGLLYLRDITQLAMAQALMDAGRKLGRS